MLAGLYGMNVELPGHETSPLMFWIISAMAMGSSVFIAFYFLKKRP
jgi:Mg2+ and Co2+ transporter CorA